MASQGAVADPEAVTSTASAPQAAPLRLPIRGADAAASAPPQAVPLIGQSAASAGSGSGAHAEGSDDAGAGAQHRRSYRTPIWGFVAAALCLVSFWIEVKLYMKYSPVYTQTECGNQTAVIDRTEIGSNSIDIGLQIEVTCLNPNPYGIEILASTPGQVFIPLKQGKDAEQVHLGKLRVLPGSHLDEYSGGVVRVRMDTSIKGDQARMMMPHFLSDSAIPLLLVLQFDVGVSISFGLVRWSVSAPFKKSCGLNMAGVLVNQFLPEDGSERGNRLGPLICRDSFDGLLPQLPRVGEKAETPEDGNMGFSAAQVAPQEVEAGELVKTISLGCSILLSLLSFVFLSLGSFAVVAHAAGLRGLVADMRTGCGFSLRVLTGYAWNGALDMLADASGVIGISAPFSDWRVPLERLQPQKEAREGEVKRCPKSSWLWKAAAGKDEETGAGTAEAAAEPPDGARWLRRLLLDRTPVGRHFGVDGHLMSGASPASCPAKTSISRGYHRLSTVGHDSLSPARSLLQTNMGNGLQKPGDVHDAIQRSRTAPQLLAVSAKRSDLADASGWDDERPPSPLPRASRGDRRTRTSSAPYVPAAAAGDAVSVADVGSPTPSAAVGGASPRRTTSAAAVAAAGGSPASVARSGDLARSAAFEEDPSARWKAKLNEPAEVPDAGVVMV